MGPPRTMGFLRWPGGVLGYTVLKFQKNYTLRATAVFGCVWPISLNWCIEEKTFENTKVRYVSTVQCVKISEKSFCARVERFWARAANFS